MANLMITDVFDIFNDIFGNMQTTIPVKKDENEIVTLNDINMKNITKEELDETMNYLKSLKDNDLTALILGDEYIDKLMGEIQAKWDIAHEEKKEDPQENVLVDSKTPDEQIEKLVDEYMTSLGIEDTLKSNVLVKAARDGYINFAKFIYNHE